MFWQPNGPEKETMKKKFVVDKDIPPPTSVIYQTLSAKT
jgi:hypothetical protein